MQKQNEFLNELREIKEILLLSQPVLSLDQFCKFASISKEQAYKLTSTGKVKFYRPTGKKIYIDREDAIDFLKQNPVNVMKTTSKNVSKHFLTSKFNAQ